MPRDLWDSRDAMKRAARERLTPAECAWVYHPPLLVPLYVALVVLASTLADAAAVAIACLAAAHVSTWLAEVAVEPGGRRAKAVLARRLRNGRHVWSVADGDRVRVYELEAAARGGADAEAAAPARVINEGRSR